MEQKIRRHRQAHTVAGAFDSDRSTFGTSGPGYFGAAIAALFGRLAVHSHSDAGGFASLTADGPWCATLPWAAPRKNTELVLGSD